MNDVSSEIRFSADVMLGSTLDIAAELLKCGAEVRRIEDTVEHICYAYGAVRVDVFAITSLIVTTVGMPDGYHKSQSRRVLTTHTDFVRIEELNALSRRICREVPDPDDLEKMVQEVLNRKKTNYPVRFAGGALMAAAFCVFFGGGLIDAAAAAAISLAMMFPVLLKPKWANDLAHTVLCALLGGLLTLPFFAFGYRGSAAMIMIGTIMLLVPGADVGNSMRDLLCGDIASGTLRLIKALLTATAIAVGYSIAVLIGSVTGILDYSAIMPTSTGVIFGTSVASSTVVYTMAGTLGTLGYVLMNRIKAIRIAPALVGGAITVLLWYLVLAKTGDLFVSNLVGAMAGTLYAEIAARVSKAPATIYLIPAVISLVPGGRVYFTMLGLVRSDYAMAGEYAHETMFVALGIAIGIVIVTTLFSYYAKIKKAIINAKKQKTSNNNKNG